MKPRKLGPKDLPELQRVFREAFPQNSFEEFLVRIEGNGVSLPDSLGVFQEEELMGFLLNIPFEKKIFHFCLGVHPRQRGKRIGSTLVQTPFPGMTTALVEADQRHCAFYEKMGFSVHRELFSFEGQFETLSNKMEGEYAVLPYEGQTFARIRLMLPSTESVAEVLMKNKNMHEVHVLRSGKRTLAYAIFTPRDLFLRELGASSEDDLEELLARMKLPGERLRLINVEENSKLIPYLRKKKFKEIGRLFELERKLP